MPPILHPLSLSRKNVKVKCQLRSLFAHSVIGPGLEFPGLRYRSDPQCSTQGHNPEITIKLTEIRFIRTSHHAERLVQPV